MNLKLVRLMNATFCAPLTTDHPILLKCQPHQRASYFNLYSFFQYLFPYHLTERQYILKTVEVCIRDQPDVDRKRCVYLLW